MRSLADPLLLETIDKLFEHNIGDYVSLPQVGNLIHLETGNGRLTLL